MDAIANWLWQGSAIALITTAIVASSRRLSATVRYRLWWLTLAVVLVLPFVPVLLASAALQFGTEAPVAAPVSSHAISPLPAPVVVTSSMSRSLTWGLLTVWACWAAISLVRLGAACVELRRAKRTTAPFPAAREARLGRWMSIRSQGRRARLAVSDQVRAAALLGPGAPVIAVAPDVLAALSDDELDAILVHEWAHVQRRDELAQLLQVIVRAIAGLHPAVWWIDRQIAIEREAACDDWAIRVTGSARGYAACLLKVATLRLSPPDSMLLPAALARADLSTRVTRLLDAGRSRSIARPRVATAVMTPILIASSLTVANIELVVTAGPVPMMMASSVVARTYPAPVAAVASSEPAPVAPRQMPASHTAAPVQAFRSEQTPTVASAPALETGLPLPLLETPQRVDVPTLPLSHTLSTLPAPPTILTGVSLPPTAGVEPIGAPASANSVTPWGAAADASVNVGRASQKAATATAGFFSKLAKSVAGSF